MCRFSLCYHNSSEPSMDGFLKTSEGMLRYLAPRHYQKSLKCLQGSDLFSTSHRCFMELRYLEFGGQVKTSNLLSCSCPLCSYFFLSNVASTFPAICASVGLWDQIRWASCVCSCTFVHDPGAGS